MNDSTIENNDNIVDIKLLVIEEAEILYELISVSRNELKNLVWAESATLQSTLEFIENKKNSCDNAYGIFHNNTLVGVLELRKKDNNFELGYWLGTPYRHQGLMKNFVKILVDQQVKFNGIVAHIRETNKASHKVLKHAGLKYHHSEVWENETWLHLKREKE